MLSGGPKAIHYQAI